MRARTEREPAAPQVRNRLVGDSGLAMEIMEQLRVEFQLRCRRSKVLRETIRMQASQYGRTGAELIVRRFSARGNYWEHAISILLPYPGGPVSIAAYGTVPRDLQLLKNPWFVGEKLDRVTREIAGPEFTIEMPDDVREVGMCGPGKPMARFYALVHEPDAEEEVVAGFGETFASAVQNARIHSAGLRALERSSCRQNTQK